MLRVFGFCILMCVSSTRSVPLAGSGFWAGNKAGGKNSESNMEMKGRMKASKISNIIKISLLLY